MAAAAAQTPPPAWRSTAVCRGSPAALSGRRPSPIWPANRGAGALPPNGAPAMPRSAARSESPASGSCPVGSSESDVPACQ